MKTIDITGHKYGKLTVIEPAFIGKNQVFLARSI